MKSPVSLMAVIFSVLWPIQVSAVELPGTPAGVRAGELIALLNGTSSLDIDDFIESQYSPGFRDAFPIASHKAIFETTRTMFGRLTVAKVSETGPDEITVVLKSESRDAWLDLSLKVEPDETHRIASIGIVPGARPDGYTPPETGGKSSKGNGAEAGAPAAGASNFSNLEELERYLREMEKDNEFSGAVLVARGDSILFQGAYGYASKRFKALNRLDTRFNLGSCNKAFTALAVTQLAEQGKLSLDDPIGDYLDMFPPEIAQKVTIRHLLNMRSGWGDYWSNEYFIGHITRLRTVSEYMEFIKDIPLDFEPGTNFQHCNTGFIVAGAIIEAVSGMDYYEYIRKHIYGPAGMKDTDSYDKDGPAENLAMGYTNMNGSDPAGTGYEWNNMYTLPPKGSPTGGGYSTAGDLLRFGNALRGFNLLSEEYTWYFLNRFEGGPGDHKAPPAGPYRIAGAAPGICAFIALDLKSSYSVIVLSNYDYPTGMNVGKEILGMLGVD